MPTSNTVTCNSAPQARQPLAALACGSLEVR